MTSTALPPLHEELSAVFSDAISSPALDDRATVRLRNLRTRLEEGEAPPGMGLVEFLDQQDALLLQIDNVMKRSHAVKRLANLRPPLERWLRNSSEALSKLEQLATEMRVGGKVSRLKAAVEFEQYTGRRAKQRRLCEGNMKRFKRAVTKMRADASGVAVPVAGEASGFAWFVTLSIAVEQLMNLAMRFELVNLTAADSDRFEAVNVEITRLVSPTTLSALGEGLPAAAAPGSEEAAERKRKLPPRFARPFRYSGGVLVDEEDVGWSPGCTVEQIAAEAKQIAGALHDQKRRNDRLYNRALLPTSAVAPRDGGDCGGAEAILNAKFAAAGGTGGEAFADVAAAFLEDDYGFSPRTNQARLDGRLASNFIDFAAQNSDVWLWVALSSGIFWLGSAVYLA